MSARADARTGGRRFLSAWRAIRWARLVAVLLMALVGGLLFDALRTERVFFQKTASPVFTTVPSS